MSPDGIPLAVRRSMQILATHRALFGHHENKPMNEHEIVSVVEVFEANQAAWALVGAHAVGLVTEPRATVDFEFIVEGGKLVAIIRDLAARFGPLDEQDMGAATRLRALDVDLIRSTNHALFQRALDDRRAIGEWQVPTVEALIVLKFLASVSPWRDRNKRRGDIADLGAMYETTKPDADRDKMLGLAKLVYPGAEREFEELLGRIDRGDPIAI